MLIFARVLPVAAVLSIAALAALSLVPGDLRPHLIEKGGPEHFAAYLGSASLFALWISDWRKLTLVTLFLLIWAGLVEIMQHWIPGRHPSISDFAFSSVGTCIGIAWIWMFRRAFWWAPAFARPTARRVANPAGALPQGQDQQGDRASAPAKATY